MILRDYQHAAVDSIFNYFNDGGQGNPLVALPTGTGKSLVICEFIKRAYQLYPNQRFIKLTHVKELIEQNYKTLLRLWPSAPAGVFSAGLGRKDTMFPITFAGIDSIVNCAKQFGRIDLIFIDEAHLVSPKENTRYQKFINALKVVNPNIRVVGFTATHYRLGQGLLTEEGGLFTDICFDMTGLESFNWLISEGYLCPVIPKRTGSELSVEGVRTQAGEYVLKELQAAVDKDEVTYAALTEAINVAHDRNHWLVFASGVDHAIHVRDMLESLGVSSAVVHSRMADKERDQAIADFKSGKVRAMVNNGILTTGFDFPELDCIVMLRPTQSPSLWVQMIGRGTRPVYGPGFDLSNQAGRMQAQGAGPKQSCLVLDFAGNTRRLGPINDPVMPRKKGKGKGHAPVKVCEKCGTYNHSSARFCINCGIEFPREVKIQHGASTDELIADGMPKLETFKVDRIVYHKHRKPGRPDSIKVSYFCGLRMFEEWVCLEHEGFARKKARDWWRQRATVGGDPPETILEAMTKIEYLAIPKRIRVWVNKKHPEINGYEY
jgi:DNA repair protein RadD